MYWSGKWRLIRKFVEPELDAIAGHEGRVVVIVSSDAKIDQLGRRVNKLTRGAVARAIESEAFEKASLGQVISLITRRTGGECRGYVKLDRRSDALVSRKAALRLPKPLAPKTLILELSQKCGGWCMGMHCVPMNFRITKLKMPKIKMPPSQL